MSRFLIVTAVLAFATAVGAAPLPATATAPAEGGPAARVKKALAETADFSFDQQSLSDVIQFVKEKAKVDVQLDQQHLMNFGIDPAQPTVTLHLKGAKIRDGLKAALAPYNLRYGVVGNTVVVSTEDGVIARQLRQRVSVDVDAKPIATVLAGLAADTGANLVLDPRIAKKAEATVTLNLDDVPLETAVRLAAEVAGLRAVRMNNVLFVTDHERAKVLRQDADGPIPAETPNGPIPIDGGGGIGVPGAPPVVVPAPAAPAEDKPAAVPQKAD